MARPRKVWPAQLAVGASLLLMSAALAIGASRFPAEKGFTVLGAHVYPYAVAMFLGIVGVSISLQAIGGGSRSPADDSARITAALPGGKTGACWVTAGLAICALLITHIGFVLTAALLFACSAYGFGSRRPAWDLAIGIALALPVYWLFTIGLGVSLPPLVNAWI
ncbi:tripartite tricarboxylate transporter TctB family protein [Azotobacter sp. CWF10]